MALGRVTSYKMIHGETAKAVSAAVGITGVERPSVEIRPFTHPEGVNLSIQQNNGNFTVLEISRDQIRETLINRDGEESVTTILRTSPSRFPLFSAFSAEAANVTREQQHWSVRTNGYSGVPKQVRVENPDEVARDLEDKATSAKLALAKLGL